MLRFAPALGWTLALYTFTAVTAGWQVGPTLPPQATASQSGIASFWFEFYHAVLHAASFAILIMAILAGHRGENGKPGVMTVVALIGLAAAVGIGQEALQSMIRGNLAVTNSLFDLACDLGGAMAAVGVMARRRTFKALG